MKKKRTFWWILLLSIVFFAALPYLSTHTALVDIYFSELVYPITFKLRKLFFERFAWSIGDLFYAGLFLVLCRGLFFSRNFSMLQKGKLFLGGLSLFLLFFETSWGLHYYRSPKETNKKYTLEQLEKTTAHFANIVNYLHHNLQEIDSLPLNYEKSVSDLIQSVQKHQNKHTLGIQGYVKPSLFSGPLTYMGFSGYLNPFTLEAQINNRIPSLSLPVTIAHEMAHQQGIAAEDEANFIGFTTAASHPDEAIQYAAYMFAFRYCYVALYKASKQKALCIRGNMRPGIFINLIQQAQFWKAYQNPLEPLFKKSYDNYLKANAQKEGIRSYNQVVALLVEAHSTEISATSQE